MAQILVPTSDQATGLWTSTPLWSKVDDDSSVNPTGDGTTITSDDNTNGDNADFKISSGTDPAVSTGHILRARWLKLLSGGHTVNAILELWQGVPGTGTQIAVLTVNNIGSSEVESTLTLSGAQADNITDYTNLYLRLSRQGDTGGPQGNRRSLVADLVELEIPSANPNATPTPATVAAVAAVPAPTIDNGVTNATATPAVVAAVAAVPAVTIDDGKVNAFPLTAATSDTDQSSYTTASVTLGGSSKATLLFVIGYHASAAPNTPTITGPTGTSWTLVNSILFDNSGSQRTLFCFVGTRGTETSGTISIDFGAQTMGGAAWSVTQFDHVDTSTGTSGVVQSATAGDGSTVDSVQTVTLSAFAQSNNATVAGFGTGANTTATPESGYTELHDVNNDPSAQDFALATEWREDAETTPSITWGAGDVIGGVAVELANGQAGTTVTPTTVPGVSSVPAPTLSTGATPTPTTVAATAAVPAPTVITAVHATPTPAVVAAVGAVPAPTVSASATVTPATVATTAAVPAPSLSTGSTVTPATVASVTTVPPQTGAQTVIGVTNIAPATTFSSLTPTIIEGPSPTTVPAVAAVPAPTIDAGGTSATATPATVAAVSAVPAPTLSTGATPTPAVVPATSAVPAPSLSTGSTPTPATVPAVTAVPGMTFTSSATVTPATVAAVASVPAPTFSTSSTVTTTTVASTAAVPPPAISSGSGTTVPVATVAATAAVPPPTLSAGATVTPTAVAVTSAVPAPSLSTSATATPVTVAAVAAVPAPTIVSAGNVTVAPATVAAISAVPSPSITATALATPAVVASIAAVPAPTQVGLGDVTITPTNITPAVTLSSVTPSGDAITPTVTTTVVAAVAAVPTPTLSTSIIVTPATVAAVASASATVVIPQIVWVLHSGLTLTYDIETPSDFTYVPIELAPVTYVFDNTATSTVS